MTPETKGGLVVLAMWAAAAAAMLIYKGFN